MTGELIQSLPECPSAMRLQETEVLPAALEIKPTQTQTEIRLKERITDAIKKTLQQ